MKNEECFRVLFTNKIRVTITLRKICRCYILKWLNRHKKIIFLNKTFTIKTLNNNIFVACPFRVGIFLLFDGFGNYLTCLVQLENVKENIKIRFIYKKIKIYILMNRLKS